MRRRDVYAAAGNPQPAPIRVEWATPQVPRTRPGYCPKCGEYVGRMLRKHTLVCQTVKIP